MAEISQPMDYLGVNYYTRANVAEDLTQPWPHLTHPAGPLDKTQMGWEIYPDGLRARLVTLARDYTGDLPLYVTENGIAWDDQVENGSIYDPERIAFVTSHLQAMKDAIAEGVNLQGFFYWSLMDNYEWAFGYERRFGMVHVDFDTMKRTPKASYAAFRALASGKGPFA